eukprot:CAMPEP_0115874116 /NCGR_PEP_ID=MMETSP0287-20121206/24363_1 /TAXON_ID=412157 /ORGANISM="Chrysochromulina rotalis, Strain UIO044" /LENGTH=177 /DNA_ID=CAMNT_0003329233 /DNA_START=57 /DNA_END=590 /DNA_ORIENTATION=+
MADLDRVRVSAPSARDEIADGATVADLRQLGFTPVELANAGVGALALRQAGYSTLQIANTRRYRANELRAAGVSLIQCLGAGIAEIELVQAGFSASEFAQIGLSRGALVNLGFGADDAAVAQCMSGLSTDSGRSRGSSALSRRPRTAPTRRPQTAPSPEVAPTVGAPSVADPGAAVL